MYEAHHFSRADRALNITLWVIQLLVLASFAIAAWMKIMFPISKLAAIWPWAGMLAPIEVRGLGVIDLLGGLGVVLPMLIRVFPKLTVVAALGCALLQVCAMSFHMLRGEANVTPVNFVLLSMALFIAWGRGKSRVRV